LKYILFTNLAGIKYIRYLSNIQKKVVNKLTNNIIALKIEVEGLVQGVGFRPFVYRLARKNNCNGYVLNKTDGVLIKIEGSSKDTENFSKELKSNHPVVALVKNIYIRKDKIENLDDFKILDSQDISDEISQISPDIAVCNDCIRDLKKQPHRLNFPFINCTNCGPRFTIVKDFPYDRDKTTMQVFEMCDKCRKEYSDISDRRFHAQPVACNECGPQYSLHINNSIVNDFDKILEDLTKLIIDGKIIAVKGMGGYHLMCDAHNESTVKRLRNSKHREGKPFAVMFRDIDKIKEYAEVSDTEKNSLLSWRRPIVLLKAKKELAFSVCVGFNTIGAFLPYMPLHHLIFERCNLPALVLTSGNFYEEPIIIDNDNAIKNLFKIADAILTYNRDIYNRTDDSVVKIINNKEHVFRRSRGYAPHPVHINLNPDGILATGAELVNCFCIGKGNQAILSQHIGDLKNYETYEFYTETIEKFTRLFRVSPSLVVSDMHPDYMSTRFAENLGIENIKVQHHHAHIASCMAENKLDETVIGVSFDGTGYGSDGNIWGSEFIVADLKDFMRYTHFEYIELPGGDKAVEEPWRTAISYLYRYLGNDFQDINLPFLKNIDRKKINMILAAIDKKINCPLSSGAGRLFDAVAAITGICKTSDFHAEAPMRLESIAAQNMEECYDFEISKTISFKNLFKEIIIDVKEGISKSIIAAKFHNTIIYVIFDTLIKIRKETGIEKVALSGGTFQNKYILERLIPLLSHDKFKVYTQTGIPCNDGGVALGQLAIAAKRRN
jgi:hydrogenase maturation protein HypF